MNTEVLSKSPEATFSLGQKIGKKLQGRELLLLCGGLGAGKTLFTKGVAQALGIDPQEVVSPTFTLMNQLSGRFTLYHLDLYRLGPQTSDHLPEIDDYLDEGIMIVEWAQFLHSVYFSLDQVIQVDFQELNQQNRKIRVKFPGLSNQQNSFSK